MVDDADSARERIGALLRGAGIQVRRLERIEPSMEDVFVARIEQEERGAA